MPPPAGQSGTLHKAHQEEIVIQGFSTLSIHKTLFKEEKKIFFSRLWLFTPVISTLGRLN
jgi:hypothetical protein